MSVLQTTLPRFIAGHGGLDVRLVSARSYDSDGSAQVFRTYRSRTVSKAAVIIPCAMGVQQKFYARFAQWLAEQGYHVTTFDYRGIGCSAPPSLRGRRRRRAGTPNLCIYSHADAVVVVHRRMK